MNTKPMHTVEPVADSLFPVVDLDAPFPLMPQSNPDDDFEDGGAEIEDDEDDDDIGNPYDEENLPEEDAFGDEDYPSEDLDEESLDHIVEEGDEAADNLLDGEVPSRLEEFELDDDEIED